MKKVFIILAISIGFSIVACGQKLKESQVPIAARDAFKKEYPNVSGKWDKENDQYEVNFKKNGIEMSVLMLANGTIMETETSIPINELPQAAREFMERQYKGKKLEEASKIVKGNGEINYEAEIKGKDVVFDVNGNFLKETKD